MITKEKLAIFEKYKGDNDAFARRGRSIEHKKMNDADWSFIEQAYNDIYLINAKRAAQVYIEQTILKLKGNCDEDCFDFLYDKIIRNDGTHERSKVIEPGGFIQRIWNKIFG